MPSIGLVWIFSGSTMSLHYTRREMFVQKKGIKQSERAGKKMVIIIIIIIIIIIFF